MTLPRQYSFEARAPASTANLGAGFDCLGLALELYLTVRATVLSEPGARTHARSRGVEGSASLAATPEQNLILRAMRHTADAEGLRLPPVRLAVQNDIPMASGLGSSAAAIVAGVALGFAVCGRKFSPDAALHYATELEGHADNAGASLLGGLVVTLVRADGSVAAIHRRWPKMIRAIAVTPEMTLETAAARAVLPKMVAHEDAVRNLQRAALFVAAIDEKRYDLIGDAMEDRLHQRYRAPLIPGLSDVLAMPRTAGLLGVALSGAGPSVIALATTGDEEIGRAIAAQFAKHGLASTVHHLAVAQDGLMLSEKRQSRR